MQDANLDNHSNPSSHEITGSHAIILVSADVDSSKSLTIRFHESQGKTIYYFYKISNAMKMRVRRFVEVYRERNE